MTSPPRTATETPRRAQRARRTLLRFLLPPVVILLLLLLIHWPRSAFFLHEAQTSDATVLSLLAATLALCGLWQLAARTANERVAWATVAVTALYPVFYEASTSADARSQMTAAALVIWGLFFYLPSRASRLEATEVVELKEGLWRRRLAAVALLASAVLVRGTAVVVPVALMLWEVMQHARRRAQGRLLLLLALALVPALVRVVYSWQSGGSAGGWSQTFADFDVLDWRRVIEACGARAWQAFGHAGLYLLTAAMLLLTVFVKPVSDAGVERGRIEVQVQLSFAFVALGYIILLSFASDAQRASEMLAVVPLVILVCVSTFWRRMKYWVILVAAACVAFAFL
ncbi:MAG TPA: glycosyltransferase family 39 protein [Pyrinomonadaceae bacterium]|nr:glycosyltransferase family 39 protein [Pyrinomonadaceae bacterium]